MFESTNKVAADNPSPRRQKDSLRGKIIEKKKTTRALRDFMGQAGPPSSSFWIEKN